MRDQKEGGGVAGEAREGGTHHRAGPQAEKRHSGTFYHSTIQTIKNFA